MRIWIIKHKPNKDPKFHKELILDGEGSSTKEPFTIFNKGWTFKIEVIINWGQFGLQDANSPIIEELIFLHDFINLILIFIISLVRYIIISILFNNYIYKRDKKGSSKTSPKKEYDELQEEELDFKSFMGRMRPRDVKNTTQPNSGKDSKKSQENTKKE